MSVSSGASYVYDGDGQRVKETDGGQTTVYVNQYFEKNLTSGVVTTHYYSGGKQIAVRKGSALSYLLQDALGSTVGAAGSTGSITGTVQYFPFGLTRSSSGSLPTDKEFTGQRLDSTGLYYYGARYYDPTMGRFISADTIVPDFTDPQSLNRYTYCLNNPLKYNDPSGHYEILEEDAQGNPTVVQRNGVVYSKPQPSPSPSSPALPEAPKTPVTTEEPEPSLPSPAEVVVTAGGAIAITGTSTLGVGYVVAGVAVVVYSIYWGVETGWFDSAAETVSDAWDSLTTFFSKQDKQLTSGEIERLKDGGINIEGLKSPGGKHAGQRDLYKDNKGNIFVKPKGGNGPGDPTGLNINDY